MEDTYKALLEKLQDHPNNPGLKEFGKKIAESTTKSNVWTPALRDFPRAPTQVKQNTSAMHFHFHKPVKSELKQMLHVLTQEDTFLASIALPYVRKDLYVNLSRHTDGKSGGRRSENVVFYVDTSKYRKKHPSGFVAFLFLGRFPQSFLGGLQNLSSGEVAPIDDVCRLLLGGPQVEYDALSGFSMVYPACGTLPYNMLAHDYREHIFGAYWVPTRKVEVRDEPAGLGLGTIRVPVQPEVDMSIEGTSTIEVDGNFAAINLTNEPVGGDNATPPRKRKATSPPKDKGKKNKA